MDIYENVIIGNFLFGLGAALGAKTRTTETPPLAINLLQQTPADKSVGDVLIQGSRAFRILEFKRTANNSKKEVSKKRVLDAALRAKGNETWHGLSRKVHWYIESQYAHKALSIEIFPYLDLENPPEAKVSLRTFISDIANEACEEGASLSSLYAGYMKILALCAKSQSGGSGALVVSVNSLGQILYAPVDNILELGLSLEKFKEIYYQRQIAFNKQHEKEIARELERDRGLEL